MISVENNPSSHWNPLIRPEILPFSVHENQMSAHRTAEQRSTALSNISKEWREQRPVASVSNMILLQAEAAKYAVTVQLVSGIADQAGKALKSLTERS